jgi:hypothetical protein
MTAAQFEQLEIPEVEAVLRWRFEALVRAGFDPGSAMILASHVEVDLHDAESLLARGCPPETALQILI